jgi:hypothetical protein
MSMLKKKKITIPRRGPGLSRVSVATSSLSDCLAPIIIDPYGAEIRTSPDLEPWSRVLIDCIQSGLSVLCWLPTTSPGGKFRPGGHPGHLQAGRSVAMKEFLSSCSSKAVSGTIAFRSINHFGISAINISRFCPSLEVNRTTGLI